MKRRILVVDCSRATADSFYARLLAHGGYEPLAAYTTEYALHAIVHHQPDIAIVSDELIEAGFSEALSMQCPDCYIVAMCRIDLGTLEQLDKL